MVVKVYDGPVVNSREETMRKVRRLRSLATLGANAEKLHLFAEALADFDDGAADELHTIAQRIEIAFDAVIVELSTT